MARARPGGPTAAAVLLLAFVEQALPAAAGEPGAGAEAEALSRGALERLRAELPEGDLARALASAPASVARARELYGEPPPGLCGGGGAAGSGTAEAAAAEALALTFVRDEGRAGRMLRACLGRGAQREAQGVLRACGAFCRAQGRLPAGAGEALAACGLIRRSSRGGSYRVVECGGAAPLLGSDPVLARAAEEASQALADGPGGAPREERFGGEVPAALLRELEQLLGRAGSGLPLGESLRARPPVAGGAAAALLAAAESTFLFAREDRCKHGDSGGGEGAPRGAGALPEAAQAHSEACAAALQAAVERPEVAAFVRSKGCPRCELETAVPGLLPRGGVRRMLATNAVPTMATLLPGGGAARPGGAAADLASAAALEAARAKRRRGAATPAAELGQLLERARAASAAGDAGAGALALGLLLGPCLLRGHLRGAALAEAQGALARVCAVYGPLCAAPARPAPAP